MTNANPIEQGSDPVLLDLRKQIDALDDSIITLIEKRLTIAKKIGQHKSRSGKPIRDEVREKEIISRIKSKADSATTETCISNVVIEILKQSRTVQHMQ